MLSPLRAIRPISRSLSPFRLARMASNTTYTPNEETEIQQWLTTAARLQQTASADDASPILDTLNSHLSTRTTLLGTKPSKADTALYSAVRPLVAAWSPEQRTGEKGYPHIVRHLDFVQNYPAFAADVKPEEKVPVQLDEVLYVKPPVDAKAEKERLKKEKAAAAAAAGGDKPAAIPDRTKDNKDKSAGEKVKEAVVEAKDKVKAVVAGGDAKPKKEKKEKAPKPQKAAAPAAPLSPALIDLRVGHILKAIKHPEADSLYVSTIAVGDEPNDDTTEYEGQVCRTVCSGLNGLVPLESMQGRKVVVVCNLKPVKMRGIKSCAMVLAASPKLKEGEVDDHKGPVELVTPPADSKAGERVYFEGWEGEPEGVLNPKKKIWETFQPGFTTTDDLAVAFDAGVVEALGKQGVGKLVTKSGGLCTVPSLKDAVVR
ncbi:Putative tRNA-binding domain, nucleic acid-binding, glutathione S-transferase domain superfamily [Colletotrichum destructivum]|uniref:tRNA-binding domain, nucleic acid-binding, glutathione S-transferase domain superfamily n=1 Tax=Colletotrichum destructivum TaxID=34406 RepID=A0AAX4IRJ7_9PEZI|nr:Putative tRNA-binding domain, nucleic acid-binding, glutathione S-transferase domain superfamily [Colletotrichum destructivum]